MSDDERWGRAAEMFEETRIDLPDIRQIDISIDWTRVSVSRPDIRDFKLEWSATYRP